MILFSNIQIEPLIQVDSDLDNFYESNDDGCFLLLADDYISIFAYKLREN